MAKEKRAASTESLHCAAMETPITRFAEESQESAAKLLNARYSNADLNVVTEAENSDMGLPYVKPVNLKNI